MAGSAEKFGGWSGNPIHSLQTNLPLGEHNAPLLPRVIHLACIQVSSAHEILLGELFVICFKPLSCQAAMITCNQALASAQCLQDSTMQVTTCTMPRPIASAFTNRMAGATLSTRSYLRPSLLRQDLSQESRLAHRCKCSSNRSVDFLCSDSEAAATGKMAPAAPAFTRLEKRGPAWARCLRSHCCQSEITQQRPRHAGESTLTSLTDPIPGLSWPRQGKQPDRKPTTSAGPCHVPEFVTTSS